jgi:hypothetical protein
MIRIYAGFAIRKSHLYNSWKLTQLAKSVKLQIDDTVFLMVIYIVSDEQYHHHHLDTFYLISLCSCFTKKISHVFNTCRPHASLCSACLHNYVQLFMHATCAENRTSFRLKPTLSPLVTKKPTNQHIFTPRIL